LAILQRPPSQRFAHRAETAIGQHPHDDTNLEGALSEMRTAFPSDVVMDTAVFRQADLFERCHIEHQYGDASKADCSSCCFSSFLTSWRRRPDQHDGKFPLSLLIADHRTTILGGTINTMDPGETGHCQLVRSWMTRSVDVGECLLDGLSGKSAKDKPNRCWSVIYSAVQRNTADPCFTGHRYCGARISAYLFHFLVLAAGSLPLWDTPTSFQSWHR